MTIDKISKKCKNIAKGNKMDKNITVDTLKCVLNKSLNRDIINVEYQVTKLHGGTLGDVKLVMGMAECINGDKVPYKVVQKVQKKWERYGDLNSWRREYDLYT
jgi:hypothetical protein